MCLFKDAMPLPIWRKELLLKFNFLFVPLFIATLYTALLFFKGNLKESVVIGRVMGVDSQSF